MTPLKSSLVRALLPTVLLMSLSVQPSRAVDVGGMGDWIKKKTEEVKQKGVPSRSGTADSAAPNQTVDAITGVVGLTAVGACGYVAQGKRDKQSLCMVGGIALAGVTKLIGNKIAAGLKERDQREVLAAASESLQSGEPVTVTLPESGSTLHVTPSADGEQKSLRLPIQIDTAMVDGDMPTLHVIGSTYRASGKADMYRVPEGKKPTVGTLAKDDEIHVLGKTGDRLLVARWVMAEGDLFPQPMAVGYVPTERLAAAEAQGETKGGIQTPPTTLKVVEADVVVTCRDIAMKREDSNGKVIEDKAVRCSGPAGIPLDG